MLSIKAITKQHKLWLCVEYNVEMPKDAVPVSMMLAPKKNCIEVNRKDPQSSFLLGVVFTTRLFKLGYFGSKNLMIWQRP